MSDEEIRVLARTISAKWYYEISTEKFNEAIADELNPNAPCMREEVSKLEDVIRECLRGGR